MKRPTGSWSISSLIFLASTSGFSRFRVGGTSCFMRPKLSCSDITRMGFESICKECGADDKHVLLGSNYRRNHHWLMVTFEALWRCVIECYVAAHQGVDLGNIDVRAGVIPWLERKAQDHKTLRFWVNFLLDDMPPYIAIRVGIRSGNLELRLAGIREFAPFFTGTGKDRYQWVMAHFLTDLARMPADDLTVLEGVTSASWAGREFANLALDESMEMLNRVIKQSLAKVTPGYTKKLAPIVENWKSACDGVEQMFYNPTKARNSNRTLINDRRKFIEKVLAFLRESPVFDDTDKDNLRSLSQMWLARRTPNVRWVLSRYAGSVGKVSSITSS